MAGKLRKFLVSEEEIHQILFADESDDETVSKLDGEDFDFLEEDVDNVGAEIDIEHPDKQGPSNPPSRRIRRSASLPTSKSPSPTTGTKASKESTWKKSHEASRFRNDAGVEYGLEQCAPDQDEGSVVTPLAIFFFFLAVMNFDTLVSDVLVK
ncbi:hypothetical protein ISCGN_022333 [Ixodes scapularis]